MRLDMRAQLVRLMLWRTCDSWYWNSDLRSINRRAEAEEAEEEGRCSVGEEAGAEVNPPESSGPVPLDVDVCCSQQLCSKSRDSLLSSSSPGLTRQTLLQKYGWFF